jgi:photosystem II stability/assembly factor-like uncharacterized protein
MRPSTRIFTFALCTSLLFTHWKAAGQWVRQAFPTSDYLFKVRFVDPDTGWVLSSHIYRTTNEGLTWIAQDSSVGVCSALAALSPNVVFYANAYSGNGIRRTTDGGSHWETVDTLSLYYTDFHFVDAQNGFAVGGSWGSVSIPTVRKTTDGGATWTTIWTGPPGAEFQGVTFVGPTLGWAVTYYGLMFHTTDGGYDWFFQDSVGRGAYFNVPMRDVQFTSPDSGWAVGGIAGNNVIARTTDAGMNWTYVRPGGSSLREIAMVDSRVGWFTGWGNGSPFIARTTNGGETWETQPFDPPDNIGFESISMVNKSVGWVCGAEGRVYRTTNGGTTFIPQSDQRLPKQILLEQNYPNPFNPSTRIRYGLPSTSAVQLTVFNTLGQQVATLVQGEQEAGYHEVRLDGTQLSSGVYFYRIQARDFVQTKKLVLLR